MKLTEKSAQVFDYIKNNGGKVSIDELATALERTSRSISANVTDLTKKGLVVREKVAGEGEAVSHHLPAAVRRYCDRCCSDPVR
jgi:predicted transcriptional regulator